MVESKIKRTNKLNFLDKLNRGTCSTWVFSPENLSLYQRVCSTSLIFSDTQSGDVTPVDQFSETACRHIKGTCSTGKQLKDKLSNYCFDSIQSAFQMKESDWQLVQCFFLWLAFPIIVFQYMLTKLWVTFTTYLLPVFLCHCYSQVAIILTFFSD